MGSVFRPKRKNKDGTVKSTKRWYIQFRDHTGKQIRRVGGVTKQQAQEALALAEKEAIARCNGLPVNTPATLRCRKLLEAFLEAKGMDAKQKQVLILRARIEFILDEAQAVMVADLSPSKIKKALKKLSKNSIGANTLGKYSSAIKGMLSWAVREGLLSESPLKNLANGNGNGPGIQRRALSLDECGRLLRAAKDGPIRRAKIMRASKNPDKNAWKSVKLRKEEMQRLHIEGQRLHLLYLLMLETGLRTNEARNLRWRDVDLEAEELHCRAEWTKNGRSATLPISPALKKALLEWREVRKAEPPGAVIPKISRRTQHQFDDDLRAAGIEKVNAAGEVVCLHSLRHTFATRLVAAGVDIKTAQELMRHASPELTLQLYAHTDGERKRLAVLALPPPGG